MLNRKSGQLLFATIAILLTGCASTRPCPANSEQAMRVSPTLASRYVASARAQLEHSWGAANGVDEFGVPPALDRIDTAVSVVLHVSETGKVAAACYADGDTRLFAAVQRGTRRWQFEAPVPRAFTVPLTFKISWLKNFTLDTYAASSQDAALVYEPPMYELTVTNTE